MTRSLAFYAFLTLPALFSACGGSSGPAAPSGTGSPTPAPAATPTPAATPAPTATPAPSPTPSVTPTPGSPTILRRASISGAAGHSASGTAEIVLQGSVTLELRSDFRIDSGNNDVILTNSTTSMDGGLNLGNMRSLTGAQSYAMPNDGSNFRYVILWCRPFRIPIGVGELR